MAKKEVTPVKVGIYTIALNEKQFVERWYNSAKEADYILIADTGSTDGTVELAKELGINVVNVTIRPWRFDTARNAAMAALPADLDYCIALDMDEILLPGWKEELQKALTDGVSRPRYQYTWNWKDEAETIPGLQYGGDKIHSRSGYVWRHPVHEVMRTYGGRQEIQGWYGLEIHHHPDNSKPRSQYLPLLAMSVEEDPDDDRNAFYYARELYFYGQYAQAAAEFKRHLALPRATWAPERAASMRYLSKIEKDKTEYWLQHAIAESPGRREPLVELATYYYERADWEQCERFALAALAIVEKPLDYLCEEFAWNSRPWDLAAIASYNLKKYDDALKYGEKAAEIEPEDQRLASNLDFYRAASS